MHSKPFAVRAPGFSKRRRLLLEDLAILTRGKVISGDKGLSLGDVTKESLGEATSVIVTQKSTSIVSTANKIGVLTRCKSLPRELENSDSAYEKSKLEEWLRGLSGGAAILRAGGLTITEQRDRKLRLEDAVHATKAAFEEGTVPGGGLCLIRVSEHLRLWLESHRETLTDEEKLGVLCLIDAMASPLKKIASNSGKNERVLSHEL